MVVAPLLAALAAQENDAEITPATPNENNEEEKRGDDDMAEETPGDEITTEDLVKQFLDNDRVKMLLTVATIAFASMAIYYFLKW